MTRQDFTALRRRVAALEDASARAGGGQVIDVQALADDELARLEEVVKRFGDGATAAELDTDTLRFVQALPRCGAGLAPKDAS